FIRSFLEEMHHDRNRDSGEVLRQRRLGRWTGGPSASGDESGDPRRDRAVPHSTGEDVDPAVPAAHAAFLKWREVPVVERVQVFYRYKTLLDKHAGEVAQILSRENGKTLDDARGSVRRAIQMVEVACGMPSLMTGYSLENVSTGI